MGIMPKFISFHYNGRILKVKDWITFILFMFVGLALFISGIIYLLKEKDDIESVRYTGLSHLSVQC
jgi:putative Mn2+ efflux pump MntP